MFCIKAEDDNEFKADEEDFEEDYVDSDFDIDENEDNENITDIGEDDDDPDSKRRKAGSSKRGVVTKAYKVISLLIIKSILNHNYKMFQNKRNLCLKRTKSL